MIELLGFAAIVAAIVALGVLPAWGGALALVSLRGNWPKGRITTLAALPLPLIIWVVCAVTFMDAATASKEECGVDACGMVIASALFLAAAAFVIFAVGLIAAAVAVNGARPEEDQP